jgi:isopropylmalate/homocitrate/citramalate synthase
MFSTPDDVYRCKSTIKAILKKDEVVLNNERLDELVQKVLDLIYATGGNYTDGSLEEYAKIYLRDTLHKYK